MSKSQTQTDDSTPTNNELAAAIDLDETLYWRATGFEVSLQGGYIDEDGDVQVRVREDHAGEFSRSTVSVSDIAERVAAGELVRSRESLRSAGRIDFAAELNAGDA
jgi:hypothetical protein